MCVSGKVHCLVIIPRPKAVQMCVWKCVGVFFFFYSRSELICRAYDFHTLFLMLLDFSGQIWSRSSGILHFFVFLLSVCFSVCVCVCGGWKHKKHKYLDIFFLVSPLDISCWQMSKLFYGATRALNWLSMIGVVCQISSSMAVGWERKVKGISRRLWTCLSSVT